MPTSAITADDFVGAWRLVSLHARSSDDRLTYPYGDAARGFIMYSADGCVSVAIQAAARARFGTRDLLAGSEAQLAEAASTYISYAGRYTVRGARVFHFVEVSLFPDWIGSTQERLFSFEGHRLTLSTDPIPLGGQSVTAVLIWERVDTST